MSGSLHHKEVDWEIIPLGEDAYIFKPRSEKPLDLIQSLFQEIEELNPQWCIDLIPAYKDLTIIIDNEKVNVEQVKKYITEIPESKGVRPKQNVTEVPVCYDEGLDWDTVESYTGLSKNDIIERHSGSIYTVAMLGFIPGFVFLDGLSEELFCPRRKSPRISIPVGSVAIGGSQTGIYSLESPGGWNIIGRTPESFFNVNQSPPTRLQPGDRIKYFPISSSEFKSQMNG